MITLFGNIESGNDHKVQMLLKHLGIPFERVEVAQTRGESRRKEFLRLNPIGKIPVLQIDTGDILTESGAILYWLGEGTPLWPSDKRTRTEVLRWMFFEQYSHEPSLAVLRYLLRFASESSRDPQRLQELRSKAHWALTAMERSLEEKPFIAADTPTIADYALYPYTRWADEAGVDIAEYAAVAGWLNRFEGQRDFLPLRTDGAVKTVVFEEFFGEKEKTG